jgi:hypothetical protein
LSRVITFFTFELCVLVVEVFWLNGGVIVEFVGLHVCGFMDWEGLFVVLELCGWYDVYSLVLYAFLSFL